MAQAVAGLGLRSVVTDGTRDFKHSLLVAAAETHHRVPHAVNQLTRPFAVNSPTVSGTSIAINQCEFQPAPILVREKSVP
jgi:hypothetical protein